MDAALSGDFYIPEDILQPLLNASNSSTLNETLDSLIGVSRTESGRSSLASKGILPIVLNLIGYLPRLSAHRFLLLSLRLVRNLCAGEVENQNLFIECNGLGVVSGAINVVGFDDIDDSGVAIIRTALQVVANVSLAGEKHQCAVWDKFFPELFLKIARIRKRETCDPLCMIVYTCSHGSIELFPEFCRTQGLAIMAETIQTASEVGFGEDWLKIILSRICLEESHFPALFKSLNGGFDNLGNDESRGINFTAELPFLLRILSEILNERLKEIHVGSEFALSVLGIFEKAVKAVDFYMRGKSGLPTGLPSCDVLGYSLTILRDVCAQGKSTDADAEEVSEDAVDSLVSRGLFDLLLSLLRELELPSSIRKSMKPGENQGLTSQPLKVCPYKGFRRDIVAVIANCSFGRKYVQDELREKNGIILLLQQCVLDEDNPFLREWGIWCASNILQGNTENQQMVADLEMQGTVEVPELAKLGLRVDIDPNTKHAKLVNIP